MSNSDRGVDWVNSFVLTNAHDMILVFVVCGFVHILNGDCKAMCDGWWPISLQMFKLSNCVNCVPNMFA